MSLSKVGVAGKHFDDHKADLTLKIDDKTMDTAMIALQGPKVIEMVGKHSREVPTLKKYRFTVKNLVAENDLVAVEAEGGGIHLPCGVRIDHGDVGRAALEQATEALLEQPEPACLVVDDVYETGRTLEPYRDLERVRHMVWVSKAEPLWWQAVEVTDSAEWIVFPWESASAAAADEAVYRASRA